MKKIIAILILIVGSVMAAMLHNDKSKGVLFLSFIIGFYLLSKEKLDVSVKEKERKEELEKVYPDFAMQFYMFLSCSLTARAAIERIIKNLEKSGRYKYLKEELLICRNELNSGTSEIKAYENLAVRCNLRAYRRWAGLITQNIKKGSADLINALKEETISALKEERANAMLRGESAATKLLVPTMLMLCIVLIIIMVPAFSLLTNI